MKIGEIITAYYGKSLVETERKKGPVPVYSSSGLTGWHNSAINNSEAIIIGRKGNVGAVYYTPGPFFCIDTAYYVLPNEKVNFRYLYYNLVYQKLGNMNDGSPVPGLKRELLYDREIYLPDEAAQQRIASILTSYDKLIENNQNQIKLLEEAAKRLYKRWFVNLRFPGYETVKIVDGLPEGWKKATFSDLCKLVKDGCSSKDISKGTPYIGLEHIPRRSICLNEWGNSSEVSSNKYRYKEYDVLFGKIRPYFHKVGFAINEGVCSTDAMVFRANENMFELLLTTAFSDEFVKHSYATCREGSKMPRADWNEMRIYPVLLPADNVLIAFNNAIRRYVDLITIKYGSVNSFV